MRLATFLLVLLLLFPHYCLSQGHCILNHQAAEIPVPLFSDTPHETDADSSILIRREPRQRESWFSRDKFYHLFGSAILSGGGYWTLEATHNEEDQSMVASFGITVCLGGMKEIYDLHHPGRQASWKDFTADVIGAALGVVIAWSLLQ